jgi:hypothetical protein
VAVGKQQLEHQRRANHPGCSLLMWFGDDAKHGYTILINHFTVIPDMCFDIAPHDAMRSTHDMLHRTFAAPHSTANSIQGGIHYWRPHVFLTAAQDEAIQQVTKNIFFTLFFLQK